MSSTSLLLKNAVTQQCMMHLLMMSLRMIFVQTDKEWNIN